MSAERPTTSPELVASLIEATPERVRKRLDRDPNAAANWTWQASGEAWLVETGGETVTLPLTHVLSVEQVRCTCLLSPQCFHVLACLSHLQVAIVDTESEPIEKDVEAGEDVVEPEPKQRQAAREMIDRVAQLLRVGIANAGVVAQSGLLRALHQCRAEGLQRLAALGLRVIAGTNEIRSRAPTSDPEQLAADVADLLETSWHVLHDKTVASFWIGTSRRQQLPVHPRKLHGLVAEPIVTRSGFAGAAVYFLGEDDRIYTVSDVRPGDVQRARDAYLGGIEMGPLIQPAKQLARGLYLGSELTASRDGRLGRGKGVRIVDQGRSSWQAEAIQARFCRPLTEQWEAVYANASVPDDGRPAGWDFVFITGRVLGALGSELLFQTSALNSPLRLAIANERDSLNFRENLRMLSYAPGLQLQVIARLNLQEPAQVIPLAIATVDEGSMNAEEPRLAIPDSMSGRICLGFDEIQRPWLIRAQPTPMVVSVRNPATVRVDLLTPLRRRWIASMLSGVAMQRASSTSNLAAEAAMLHRSGFATGAALVDSFASATLDAPAGQVGKFLAAAVYLRECGHELSKAMAAWRRYPP